MDNYWLGDHNFNQTCTLTVYDNLQNASSATISWQSELVPMNNFIGGANWVGSDEMCLQAGNRVSTYLVVQADFYINGVLKNTVNNINAFARITGLSPDTDYTGTISVTFTDQYGRSETLTTGNTYYYTGESHSRWWSKVYSSYPSGC